MFIQILISLLFLLGYGLQQNDPYHWIAAGIGLVGMLIVKLIISLNNKPVKPRGTQAGTAVRKAPREAGFMVFSKGIIFGLLSLFFAWSSAFGLSFTPVYDMFYDREFVQLQSEIALLTTPATHDYPTAIEKIENRLKTETSAKNTKWLKEEKLRILVLWGTTLDGDARMAKFTEAESYAKENGLDPLIANLYWQLAQPSPTPEIVRLPFEPTPRPGPVDLQPGTTAKLVRETSIGASTVVFLSVSDSNGFVQGLGSKDFMVYANGMEVPTHLVIAQSQNDAPDAVYNTLLIDTSGSMNEPKNSGDPVPMIEAKNAARAFITSMRPQDRVRVGGFSSTVTMSEWLSPDEALLIVDKLVAKGDTALWDALYDSGSNVPEGVAHNVVLLSDGADTASSHTSQQAVDHFNGTLFAVVLQSKKFDPASIDEFATDVNGEVNLTDATSLVAKFEEISNKTMQMYILTIVSPDPINSLRIIIGGANSVEITK